MHISYKCILYNLVMTIRCNVNSRGLIVDYNNGCGYSSQMTLEEKIRGQGHEDQQTKIPIHRL